MSPTSRNDVQKTVLCPSGPASTLNRVFFNLGDSLVVEGAKIQVN